MNTARLLHTEPPNEVGAVWKIYELDPPHEGAKVVVVSANNVMFSGPETYIFPAEKRGDVYEISDWGELDGSYRGGLDHAEALRLAGYEVVA